MNVPKSINILNMPKSKSRTNSSRVSKADVRIESHLDVDLQIEQRYKLKPVHEAFVKECYSKHTKMAFVDGPAGTAKTYCAAFLALNLLKGRHADEVIYIRSIIESASKSMGSLPGEIDDKFLPWTLPLTEKLHELLLKSSTAHLFEQDIIRAIPVNYVRGLTFKDSVVIVDEAQNLTKSELITILTRTGENTKMLIIGDTQQSDINGRSGFNDIYDTFNDDESVERGIKCFKFTEQDITRSEILKFLISKLSANK